MKNSVQPLRVVCVGDSLTRGQVSVDYVKMLASRDIGGSVSFTHAGVNGDLAFNVLQRLDSVIDLQPDAVSVLIGTNDTNASLSEKNIRMMTRMKKLPKRPTIEWYRENLTAIVDRLAKESSARIALLSLPVLGEELGSEPVRRSADYSAVVKEIADTRGVTYLPLNERQVGHLTAGGVCAGNPVPRRPNSFRRCGDTTLRAAPIIRQHLPSPWSAADHRLDPSKHQGRHDDRRSHRTVPRPIASRKRHAGCTAGHRSH